MTVAALPTSGIAARTRPAVISQKVAHPSLGDASEVPRARAVMKVRKPAMKNVVHTSTSSTPWIDTLW